MRTSLSLAAALCCLLATPQARAQEESSGLKLSAGTFQLGGNVSFSTYVAASGSTQSGFTFDFSPSGGYFVADNFELVGSLMLSVPFGDIYDGAAKNFGLSFGGRYFFGMGSNLALYAGLGAGFGYYWAESTWVGTIDDTDFVVSLPVGLLIALNSHVAIDVGLSLNLTHFFDADATAFTFPIGYLGVQAFF